MLRRRGGANGVHRVRKDGAKAVADGFEHLAAVPLDDGSQKMVMARQRPPHPFREVFPQGRTAFYVGKKKGPIHHKRFCLGHTFTTLIDGFRGNFNGRGV